MFYVSTTFIKDNESVFKAINMLKKKKIYNIELGSNHIWEKKIKLSKLKDFNLCVHNYFPVPKNKLFINIASQNNNIRRLSISQIKNSIKFSKKISSKLYTFHPGFLTDPDGSNLSKKNYDFLWNKKKLISKNYKKSWKLMILSIKEIVKFAKKNNVKIAIETEGSINSKDHLLMQRPGEYKNFFKIFKKQDIGINLNLGHLNLASKAFGFNKIRFVENFSNKIVAMELSHNYGKNDDHLPIKKNAWYWPIIKKDKYRYIPKILEFRYTNVNIVKRTYDLVNETI